EPRQGVLQPEPGHVVAERRQREERNRPRRVLEVEVAVRKPAVEHGVAVPPELDHVSVGRAAPDEDQGQAEERDRRRDLLPHPFSRNFASSSASRWARIVFWSASREITV